MRIVDVVGLLLGGAFLLGGVIGCTAGWGRRGVSRDQRWLNIVALGSTCYVFGTGFLVFAFRPVPSSVILVWTISVYVVSVGALVAAAFLKFTTWTEKRRTEVENAEFGVPPEPLPLPFWTWPFWVITILGSVAGVVIVAPWVILGNVDGWVEATLIGQVPDYSASFQKLGIGVGIVAGTSVLAGITVTTLRWRLRRAAITRHSILVAGIARERDAAYRRGYDDAHYDKPANP